MVHFPHNTRKSAAHIHADDIRTVHNARITRIINIIKQYQYRIDAYVNMCAPHVRRYVFSRTSTESQPPKTQTTTAQWANEHKHVSHCRHCHHHRHHHPHYAQTHHHKLCTHVRLCGPANDVRPMSMSMRSMSMSMRVLCTVRAYWMCTSEQVYFEWWSPQWSRMANVCHIAGRWIVCATKNVRRWRQRLGRERVDNGNWFMLAMPCVII